MLISWTVLLLICVVAGIVVGRICGGPISEYDKGALMYLVSDRFGLSCLATTGILWGGCWLGLFADRVYVVDAPKHCTLHFAFGTPTFEFEGGESVEIADQCVVNATAQPLILESVAYGDHQAEAPGLILSHSTAKLDHGVIQYFFDDTPPQTLEVKSKVPVSGATQWWLHDADYSLASN